VSDNAALWTFFFTLVLAVLLLDLRLSSGETQQTSFRRAVIRLSVWLLLAFLCSLLLGGTHGVSAGKRFGACYLKSLSVDHVLVFFALFSHFAVPLGSQHRILFWGAIINVALRAKLVFVKLVLLGAASWMVYVFGAALVAIGIKILRRYREPPVIDAADLWSVRLVRSLLPVAAGYQGPRFIVREGGRWQATPALLVLFSLELCDICYALDEIPAMLAISREAFTVVSANTLAAMTLRALYLVIAPYAMRFVRVRAAAGLLLVFSGIKLLTKDVIVVPDLATLAVIIAVMTAAVLWSLRAQSASGPE
jgi:tellurite resistance protein TerC